MHKGFESLSPSAASGGSVDSNSQGGLLDGHAQVRSDSPGGKALTASRLQEDAIAGSGIRNHSSKQRCETGKTVVDCDTKLLMKEQKDGSLDSHSIARSNDSSVLHIPLLLTGVIGGAQSYAKHSRQQMLTSELSSVPADAKNTSLDRLTSQAHYVQAEASKALNQSNLRLEDAKSNVEKILQRYKGIEDVHTYGTKTREILEAQRSFAETGFHDKLRSADIKARTGTLEELMAGNPQSKNSKIFLDGSVESKIAHEVRAYKHVWEQNERTGQIENNVENLCKANVSRSALWKRASSGLSLLDNLPEMSAVDLLQNRSRIAFLNKLATNPAIAHEGIGDLKQFSSGEKPFLEGSNDARVLLKLSDSHAEMMKAQEIVEARNSFNKELSSLVTSSEGQLSSSAGLNPSSLVERRSLPVAVTMGGFFGAMALGLGTGLAGHALDKGIEKVASLGSSDQPNEIHSISDTTLVPLLLRSEMPALPKFAAVGATVSISRIDTLLKLLNQRH